MASSGVRRLAMSKMVAKEKKPVKAVFGLFARILGTGGRKIPRLSKNSYSGYDSVSKIQRSFKKKI
jgi:hypothetical protein